MLENVFGTTNTSTIWRVLITIHDLVGLCRFATLMSRQVVTQTPTIILFLRVNTFLDYGLGGGAVTYMVPLLTNALLGSNKEQHRVMSMGTERDPAVFDGALTALRQLENAPGPILDRVSHTNPVTSYSICC